MKKKLLVYEKEKIEEFICKVESEKGKVFPVSYLMDKNVNLKYNGINDEECFVLDVLFGKGIYCTRKRFFPNDISQKETV